MDNLMDALDERLFELGGKMTECLIRFHPGVGPEGVVAWERLDPPLGPERAWATHRVYFRDDRAILESGRYDRTKSEALDDMRARFAG